MFKYPYILRAVNSAIVVPPEKEQYLVPANVIEDHLKEKLSSIYGNLISTLQKVGYYFPDITYIDTDKNIFIDIEIDEPYFDNRIPTHYLEDKREVKRDNFFIQNGWHVIRFSENQVKSEIDNVIKTIGLFIESIISKSDSKLVEHLELFSENRWTQVEAIEYAKNNKREYYDSNVNTILQANQTILREFKDLNAYLEFVKDEILHVDYSINELIYIPYFISNIYSKSKSKLIYIDCVSPGGNRIINGKFVQIPSLHRTPPRIEISYERDPDSFYVAYEIKARNTQIILECEYGDKNTFYSFFFFGESENYRNSTLKMYRI